MACILLRAVAYEQYADKEEKKSKILL